MSFLSPNQQHQSTEGTCVLLQNVFDEQINKQNNVMGYLQGLSFGTCSINKYQLAN